MITLKNNIKYNPYYSKRSILIKKKILIKKICLI